MPVPVRLIVCLALAALSVRVTTAVRMPTAVGRNVTLMMQLAPAATDEPHVLAGVRVKSPLLVPVRVMLAIARATPPLFVSVTDFDVEGVFKGWLVNVRLVPLRSAVGVPPVPVRVTICGLVLAASVNVMEPVRGPFAVGVNVTLIVQLVPSASVAGDLGQVSFSAKSPLLGPVTAMVG